MVPASDSFFPLPVTDMQPTFSDTIEPRGWNVDMAARYTGLTISTLNKMRCRGDGPKFIRLAPNRIAYLREDLDAWIDAKPRLLTTADDLAAREMEAA